MLGTENASRKVRYVQRSWKFDGMDYSVVVLNLPFDCTLSSYRRFLAAWSHYSSGIARFEWLNGFEVRFFVGDASRGTAVHDDAERV
jgi:hypothetical protein